MELHPILLCPSGKDYLWGGQRLKTDFGKQINMNPLAETWECSVHPDGPSFAAMGEFEGKSLQEILDIHPEYLGTKFQSAIEFPVLIKFIDAAKNLSVQVHPSDEYAYLHENGQRGKTEMWYVLDAVPNAKLVWGFEHKVTAELLKKNIADGTLDNDLHYVPVKSGDVFFIQAGTVHAIGAGILLVEIQESSNLTYRLYDYNRRDKNGKLRQLRFDKAVQVLNMNPIGITRQKNRLVKYSIGCCREVLCRCKYFEVERILVKKRARFTIDRNSFQVLLCLNGKGSVWKADKNKNAFAFVKGSCVFLPANLGECMVEGACELLKIRC